MTVEFIDLKERHTVAQAIERIRNAYNTEEQEVADNEGREAFLLPHFTCHQLRHTFCTRLVEMEPRAKVVQTIMGHANISTTMDVYAEVEKRAKQETVTKLQGSFFIR